MIAITKSNFIGIGIIIICTLLTTIAQLSFKIGAPSLTFSPLSLINPYLIFGFIAYGLAAILLVIALRLGDLSLLYPVWSLSFVWITIASMFFLGESIGIQNWLGISLIIAGISFIGFGARNG